MAEKKNKQKSIFYKIFIDNIEIKILALLLALFVTVVANIT